jgi:hypothetical protein
MRHEPLEWLALTLLLGMPVFLIYLIIFIHDIPYQMAKKRQHPQQDAIFVGCWLSLFTLHLMWPLLFIWAVSRRAPLAPPPGSEDATLPTTLERIAALEKALSQAPANPRRETSHD